MFPVYIGNFSETPCVKVGFDVRIFRVFLGYNILILVFLGSPGKFCAEMKCWYF